MIQDKEYDIPTSTFGYVIDYNKEDVVHTELYEVNEKNFMYFCPSTDNYYNAMDVFDNEQVALEYYLGEIIKEKNDQYLYYDTLETRIKYRLMDHIR